MYHTVPPQRSSVRLKAFPFVSSFFCAMLVSLLSSTTQHTTACRESLLTFFLLFLPSRKSSFFVYAAQILSAEQSHSNSPLGGRGRAGNSRLMRTAYSRTLCLPCPMGRLSRAYSCLKLPFIHRPLIFRKKNPSFCPDGRLCRPMSSAR